MTTELTTLPTLGSGEMFDRIAPRYDLLNRVLSLGLDKRWRRRVVRALGLGKAKCERGAWFGERPRVLDVATGTADLAIAIARKHTAAEVVGRILAVPAMMSVEQRVDQVVHSVAIWLLCRHERRTGQRRGRD